MFKLHNYTLRQRIYFLAYAGIIGIAAITAIAILMYGASHVIIAPVRSSVVYSI